MGPTIIARSYAETLLELAKRRDPAALHDFGVALHEVVGLLRSEPRIRQFLETPRVETAAKQQAMRAAFAGRVPDVLLRFLLVVVAKRRQALLPRIAAEYEALVEAEGGRIRADIALARAADAELQRDIVAVLQQQAGREIVPHFRVEPALLGGFVANIGDQVVDASLRHRFELLRRRLFTQRLPQAGAADPS